MSAEVLAQIAKEVAVCTKCELCKGRTKAVPGEGSANATVMFIGEAPGYHEDQQGRPFIGPSGQLLDRMFKALKMTRQDVYIGNVVKCRPPQNRDPKPEEIEACKPYLDRQIAAINPRVIVTLGRFSMARWWPGGRISQLHGQAKTEGGRIIMPMFHPAAALRDQERTYQMFREDAFTIPALIEKSEEIARTELWGFVPTEPEIIEPEKTIPVEKVKVTPAKAEKPVRVKAAAVAPPEIKVAEEMAEYQPTPVMEETAPVLAVTTEEVPEIVQVENKEENAVKAARPRKKKEDVKSIAEQLTMF